MSATRGDIDIPKGVNVADVSANVFVTNCSVGSVNKCLWKNLERVLHGMLRQQDLRHKKSQIVAGRKGITS